MTESQTISPSFFGLGIAPRLLEALDRLKLTIPTSIQRDAIPPLIEGKDLIGIAQTGTGKTLAFAIPAIQRLASIKGQALVLLPTRELALQVDEVFHKLGRPFGLRTAVLIGGQDIKRQFSAINKRPHIIVATPGRLIDHLEQKTIHLNEVNTLVLDEADRMLDMGFLPQITRILKVVPASRQTMLFSATMPEDIVRIAANYMKLPVRVEIARPGTAADKITHELFVITREAKNLLLEKLLTDYRGSTLVFCRTKFNAKKVTRAVQTMGHRSAEIHSNRSLAQRREALDGFKSGRYRVLVATDIAARGIDVTGIELVINYDLPSNPGDYVHRIGRTGRAGLSGRAISFATPDQRSEVREIEKLVRIMLPPSRLPTFPPRQPTQMGEKHTAHQTRGAQYSHSGHSRRPPHRQYR